MTTASSTSGPSRLKAAGGSPLERQAARAAIDPRRLLILLAQMAALLVVIREFNIEGAKFVRLTALCFGGFLLHYLVPFAWKKQTFVAISLVGAFALLFNPDEQASQVQAWVIAISALVIVVGLGLTFYVCMRLPINFWARVGLVVGIGAVLAYLRHRLFLSEPYWHIIGAIFMFRLIIYVHDVKYAKAPEKLLDFLSYFFLLPNFYFVLFPVIDYTTFKKSWYADDIHATAQRGITWIARGVMHLCLYRLVYHRAVITPENVQSFPTLLLYLFHAFWLYLKVSGYFHIIIGMVHLFGYKLPETNKNYFLASSFTDFWRRINIYWKDFMVKCVYYPVYFRLRKNETVALVVATLVVFLATTLLHSYQTFWLQGSFELNAADGWFWGILGVLVLANVLLESRKKPAARDASKGGALFKRIVSTIGVYVTISVLWSMWSYKNPSEWLQIVMYWN